MNPLHPGNEPDPGDMSSDPTLPSEEPVGHELPEDDAEKLGGFA